MEFKKIDSMTGQEFETFIGDFLKENEIDFVYTRSSGDFGADLLVEFNDARFAIQCKRYSSPIGVSAVQEVIASLKVYGATVGAVVTNNTFTRQAQWLANTNGVILIGRSELRALLNGADIRMYLYNTKFRTHDQ